MYSYTVFVSETEARFNTILRDKGLDMYSTSRVGFEFIEYNTL